MGKLVRNGISYSDHVVDDRLNGNSKNPVQNKVVVDALNTKVGFTDYATTSVAGLVKPDNSTTTIDADGTIHAPASGSLQYSTSEQWTGNRWVNGNKIYVKCYTGLSVSTGNNWVSLGVSKPSGIDTIIDATMLGSDTNSIYSIATLCGMVAINNDTNELDCITQSYFATINTLILTYTKTSDD